MHRLLKRVGIAITLLIVFLILLLATLMYGWHIAPFWGDKFDKEIWHQNIIDDWRQKFLSDALPDGCPLGSMYTDLKYNFLNEGTPKSKVVGLLGEAYEPAISRPECIEYYLGECSSQIDYDTLTICFDERDKIISVRHVQH